MSIDLQITTLIKKNQFQLHIIITEKKREIANLTHDQHANLMNCNMRLNSRHNLIKLASELSQRREINHKGRCTESTHQTRYRIPRIRFEEEKRYIIRRQRGLEALEASQKEVHVPSTCGEKERRREEREGHGEKGGERGGEIYSV